MVRVDRPDAGQEPDPRGNRCPRPSPRPAASWSLRRRWPHLELHASRNDEDLSELLVRSALDVFQLGQPSPPRVDPNPRPVVAESERTDRAASSARGPARLLSPEVRQSGIAAFTSLDVPECRCTDARAQVAHLE